MPISRFDPRTPVIVLRVKLEHQNKFMSATLVLDTGSSYSVISNDLMDYLNLKIRTQRYVPISTVSQVENLPFVIVPKISFIGLEVENVACLVKDIPEAEGIDGLLGLSFLKNLELKINFRKGILEIN